LAESKNRSAELYSVKITLLCDFDGYLFVKNQFLRLHAPSKMIKPANLTESKNRTVEHHSVKPTLFCDFDGK